MGSLSISREFQRFDSSLGGGLKLARENFTPLTRQLQTRNKKSTLARTQEALCSCLCRNRSSSQEDGTWSSPRRDYTSTGPFHPFYSSRMHSSDSEFSGSDLEGGGQTSRLRSHKSKVRHCALACFHAVIKVRCPVRSAVLHVVQVSVFDPGVVHVISQFSAHMCVPLTFMCRRRRSATCLDTGLPSYPTHLASEVPHRAKPYSRLS